MARFLLRSMLLMICLMATVSVSGCTGDTGTGHVEDKTPGGDPTPPVMDDAAMDEYSKKQGEAAGTTP